MNPSPNPFIESKIEEFSEISSSAMAHSAITGNGRITRDTVLVQIDWLRTALTEAIETGRKEERDRVVKRLTEVRDIYNTPKTQDYYELIGDLLKDAVLSTNQKET